MDQFIRDTVTRLKISRGFIRACLQIIQLKNQIRSLSSRYKTAKRRKQRSIQRSLAIRIDVTEGMRRLMYEHARDLADELSNTFWRLFQEVVIYSVDYDVEDHYHSDEESDDDPDAQEELMYDSRRN